MAWFLIRLLYLLSFVYKTGVENEQSLVEVFGNNRVIAEDNYQRSWPDVGQVI